MKSVFCPDSFMTGNAGDRGDGPAVRDLAGIESGVTIDADEPGFTVNRSREPGRGDEK